MGRMETTERDEAERMKGTRSSYSIVASFEVNDRTLRCILVALGFALKSDYHCAKHIQHAPDLQR